VHSIDFNCIHIASKLDLSELPPKLLQRLMPFQLEGVEFALSRNGRCMIADEMGLGKTVQAIAVALAYRREWPLLVAAPSSLRYPWVEELERWIPELQPGDINLVESKSHTVGISSSKVTVLGYGLLTSDARPLVEALTRQRFAVVVADEAHYLKSRNAARTAILAPLVRSAKRAVLLTGTPALGRPEELFTQIDALYPGRFGTWTDYAKKYCNPHYRYFGARRQWDCRGASNLEELHRRLSEVMIRRLKADVLGQLPPKVRQRIPFDLPKEAAKEASASLAEWERLTKGLGSGVVATENPFVGVMSLVTQMYHQTAVAKAGAVKDYIKMMLEAEQLKFLVFAHHLAMLRACAEAAAEAKAGYIRIDGSVPSSERNQLVHKFQNDPETRVAILSIQAAGQGLTLTAASHVVFAELYWNPGHIKQAEDRAHRIGQTTSVNVHYLIAKGTFDAVMWSMLNRKETVTGSTLNGRKGYLEANEGDKDKWDFLNFASAWTPGEVAAPERNAGSAEDEGFEKDKQHDIRSFFSPSAAKDRRKRSGGGSGNEEREEEEEEEDVFSPQPKRPRTPESGRSRASRRWAASLEATWDCGACTYANSGLLPYCEMCEGPRPSPSPAARSGKDSASSPVPVDGGAETRSPPDASGEDGDGDGDQLVHPGLQFRASQYTDRIYLYSKDGDALNLSFIPLDIQLTNWDDLPEAFSRRRENRTQVLRLVREWSSLPAMKQKLLRRSGLLFHSPDLGLRQLAAAQRPHSSTKRYLGRDEVARASLTKARQEGGSVRLVAKGNFFARTREDQRPCEAVTEQPSSEPCYVQAVDSGGVPLCLSCQQACPTTGGALDTRFCSRRCEDEFQLRSSQSYMRSRVLEAERGVCQHCGLDAHGLFLRVRDAPPPQRKELLENTWLAQLPLKQLNGMIRAPAEGDFWQVDHIRPVYSGGGQCSLDNLQTLCTVCHKGRTALQAKDRSQTRKSAAAAKVASDISRFFVRK
uniref:Zinc finger, RAN-binding domain containing 3 n=1 Tax=Kryptolebias marmoratus TaxID=37003 RepID=A0A3Q3G0C0_KRYMA